MEVTVKRLQGQRIKRTEESGLGAKRLKYNTRAGEDTLRKTRRGFKEVLPIVSAGAIASSKLVGEIKT